jgi:hypothetical protein
MRNAIGMSARGSLAATEVIRCVVIETGSLRLTDSDAECSDQTIVVAQMQDEAAADFAERVLERITTVERTGRHVRSATVLAGNRHEEAAQAARRRLVLGLATHLQPQRDVTSLTLRASRETAPEHRAELLDLAADVMAYRGPTSTDTDPNPVGVRLRFDEGAPEPRHQSGTFHAIPDKSVSRKRAGSRPSKPGAGT